MRTSPRGREGDKLLRHRGVVLVSSGNESADKMVIDPEDHGEEIELMSLHNAASLNGDESADYTSLDECNRPRELQDHAKESPWRMLAQALPSTLVAGLGMVAAGIVLNIVQVKREGFSCHTCGLNQASQGTPFLQHKVCISTSRFP